MSLLSELKDIAENCGVKVETGVFSDTPPDEYIVLTPLADSFEMHCDNLPEYEIQEVRISIFSKGNSHFRRRGRRLSCCSRFQSEKAKRKISLLLALQS